MIWGWKWMQGHVDTDIILPLSLNCDRWTVWEGERDTGFTCCADALRVWKQQGGERWYSCQYVEAPGQEHRLCGSIAYQQTARTHIHHLSWQQKINIVQGRRDERNIERLWQKAKEFLWISTSSQRCSMSVMENLGSATSVCSQSWELPFISDERPVSMYSIHTVEFYSVLMKSTV